MPTGKHAPKPRTKASCPETGTLNVWGNDPYAGLSESQVLSMPWSQVTSSLNARVHSLLQDPGLLGTKGNLGSGVDLGWAKTDNPFVQSLTFDVPKRFLEKENVIKASFRKAEFAPWMYALYTLQMIDRFAYLYSVVNHEEFPRADFVAQRDRVHNRVKRMRHRGAGGCDSPPSTSRPRAAARAGRKAAAVVRRASESDDDLPCVTEVMGRRR